MIFVLIARQTLMETFQCLSCWKTLMNFNSLIASSQTFFQFLDFLSFVQLQASNLRLAVMQFWTFSCSFFQSKCSSYFVLYFIEMCLGRLLAYEANEKANINHHRTMLSQDRDVCTFELWILIVSFFLLPLASLFFCRSYSNRFDTLAHSASARFVRSFVHWQISSTCQFSCVNFRSQRDYEFFLTRQGNYGLLWPPGPYRDLLDVDESAILECFLCLFGYSGRRNELRKSNSAFFSGAAKKF